MRDGMSRIDYINSGASWNDAARRARERLEKRKRKIISIIGESYGRHDNLSLAWAIANKIASGESHSSREELAEFLRGYSPSKLNRLLGEWD